MTKALRHIVLALSSILAVVAGNAATHTIKASLDSAYLLMGKQTRLHIEIVEDAGADGALLLPGDTLVKEVEIVSVVDGDTIDLGNNRRQINRDLIIQSFDSGLYTLPPLPYLSGSDTSYTNPTALKVIPVLVDSLATIHPYAGTVAGESRWYDFLPDWITDYWQWIVLGIVIIAGGVVAILMYMGKTPKIIRIQPKPVPPYELAMRQLNELRERHLCENGQEREFYTRLTDILREYLERRFGINAMEMTSTQIVNALQGNADTRVPNAYMKQILEIADFVKFAKMRPLPDDNVKAFNSAIKFVEDTRPQSSADNESTVQGQPNNED